MLHQAYKLCSSVACTKRWPTAWQHARWALQASSGSCSSCSSTAGTRSLSSKTTPGLFGITRLQTPGDFPRWAEDAKDRCNELVQHVMSAPPDAAVIRMVDDISDTVCQVYDSAECVRNIHPDASWRQAATSACQTLGTYLADINHHEGLYNKLVMVQDAYTRTTQALQGPLPEAGGSSSSPDALQGPLLSQQQLSEFCPETHVVAAKYRQDFEKFGIHLQDSNQRARVAQLLALNQHFPSQFNATLADPKKVGRVQVMPSGRLVSLLGPAGRLGALSVPLDSGSIHHFLATTDNEDARRQVYMAGCTGPPDNLVLLDHMLTARHQLATLLGHSSYAAFKAADGTLAGSPYAAEAFLLALLEGSRQHADQELLSLTTLKRKHTNNKGAVLQPWDQEFYTRQLSHSKPHIEAAAAAAPYLQLGSVLEGISSMLQQLLGLRLTQQPVGQGEVWSPGVVKVSVECQELGPLGLLYLDLLTRPGKPGASGILYPLRCGRQQPDGSYQQPILCLVGNLSASHSGSTTDPSRLLLTWREFRTLMHEVGHAVHSLVSRTRYQHVWGTRCSQDMVEVPSHLWEHFTSAPQALSLLARHHHSKEPMPPKLVDALGKGWSQFSSVTPALELQQQALLSLIDLKYHGTVLPSACGGSSSVWQEAAQQHSSIPPPVDSCPQARFTHLTIYGACYYSYLFARCIAQALWDALLAADPLNPCAGQHLRKSLLEPGGSVDPVELLQAAFADQGVDTVLWPQQDGWSPNPQSLLLQASDSHTL